MKTVFQRAHIVSPDVDLPDASLVVADGVVIGLYLPGEVIPEREFGPASGDVECYDLGGDLLLPGFFDIHTHGGANHDFCDATPEALAAFARHKLTQGVTSFLGTTLTLPEARLAEAPATLWLFDYHLDDGDTGIALAADLAARHGAQPTLILSADGGHAVRHAVLEAGHALLAKPLKPLALKSVLDRLLAGRGVQPAPAVTGT